MAAVLYLAMTAVFALLNVNGQPHTKRESTGKIESYIFKKALIIHEEKTKEVTAVSVFYM